MSDWIVQELAKPIIRRLGTAMGSALLVLGMNAETTAQVETAATALALFALDLLMSHRARGRR